VENAGTLPARRGSLAALARARHAPQPGLREVSVLWGLFLLVGAEIFATYARTPVHELYHVSENGRAGGGGRVVVFLNWPLALAAIAMLPIVAVEARSRAVSVLSLAAGLLCGAVLWPGVVDQADLDVKWSNAIAASGVLLALALTLGVLARVGIGPRRRVSGDRARVGATAALALIALPWIAADLGFVIGRWPLLGSIFYSDEWYAALGHARAAPAVHVGHHHGMAGALLVVTAVVLSRTLGSLGPRTRIVLGIYLAILLVYGAGNIANDFWLEQIVKRGVTNWQVPSVIVPALTLPWLIMLALVFLAYVLLFRRVGHARLISARSTVWPALLPLPVLALVAVGLAHGSTHHVTPRGTADGIVFAAAPHGTWHLFETRGGAVVQLTAGHGADLAPAWSPDGRRIAFQSNRDGNWEIYVMNADGTGIRRLTDDDARDGEPSWSPDGRRIAFVHNGHLFELRVTGGAARTLEQNGEWPSWSSDGKALAWDVEFGEHYHGILFSEPGRSLGVYGTPDDRRPVWSSRRKLVAYECRFGAHWHICLLDPRTGSQRVLTGHRSDSFAPTWSLDGTHLAFISDRDGLDQLFVMRSDGTAVVRLTSDQADKDTPAWRP
jgi:WD40-like Beta Propeller Repeat